MKKRTKYTAMLGALAAVAVLGTALPALAQESGAEVWGRVCGRCHRAQPPNKYDADSWKAIVAHMAIQARLTTDEEDAVREFLMAAGHKLTAAPAPKSKEEGRVAATKLEGVIGLTDTGGEIYRKQCVACHGKTGKGDGPAAVALTPKPKNLADPEGPVAKLSDEQLIEVLTKGKGTMPGFSALLSPDEIKEVVAYIRELEAKQKAKKK
ncbi:MAG: c-type cytochrome [Gemmatimonadota bacterium]